MWTHWDILHWYSCLFAKNNKSHTWFFFSCSLIFQQIFHFSNLFDLCWFIINWYSNNTYFFHPNKSNITMDHILFFVVNFHARHAFGLHWGLKNFAFCWKNGGSHDTVYAFFGTIYRPHCTFWYYSWASLYYFN